MFHQQSRPDPKRNLKLTFGTTALPAGLQCASLVPVLLFLAVYASVVLGQGTTTTIAITGNSASGNGTFSGFSLAYLNDAGQIAFGATASGTTGGSTDNYGIWRASGIGSPLQLARTGQFAPDGNGTIGLLGDSSGIFSFNGMGEIATRTLFVDTNAGANDNQGVLLWRSGSLQLVARGGGSAPNGNGVFDTISNVSLNNSGLIAFESMLRGTSGGLTDNQGIFRVNAGGETSIMAIKSQSFGGSNVQAIFPGFRFNGNGQIAANLNLTSGIDAIVRGTNYLSLTEIARDGQTAPDGDGFYALLIAEDLNNAGHVLFRGFLAGTSGGSSNDQGIFLRKDGANVQVARRGQSTPNGNGVFKTFGNVALNDLGHTAFASSISGSDGDEGDDFGLFLHSGTSTRQVFREGDLSPDGIGTFMGFLNSGVSLNKHGQVAFGASLTSASGSGSDFALFLGDGGENLIVARQGQPLGGSAISRLYLAYDQDSSSGLNSFGQLAYIAELANGVEMVRMFTPDLRWRGPTSGSWNNNGNWTVGIKPAAVHKVFIDPAGSTTVYGPMTNTTVRQLQIGGDGGLATLQLQNGSILTATDGVTIAATGRLTGDGRISGPVLNYGVIETANSGANVLGFRDNITNLGIIGGGRLRFEDGMFNNGLITGSGRIEKETYTLAALYNNYDGGEIRVLGGESRVIDLDVINNGRIESIGGTIEFNSTVTNNSFSGLITGRNAIYRFDGGLINSGGMGFSFGTSDVFGDVTNHSGGVINLSGGANVTFYDDIVQDGGLQIGAVGGSRSTAVVFGSFSGTGGFTGGGDLYAMGDLRPGASPASVLMDGNLFFSSATNLLVELGGMELGQFDQLRVTGDLSLGGDLLVSTIDGFQLDHGQQFLIADILGNRFGQFTGLEEGSLVGILGGRRLFITYSAGNGNDVALFTAVPEPSALVLFSGLALLTLTARRRPNTLRVETGDDHRPPTNAAEAGWNCVSANRIDA